MMLAMLAVCCFAFLLPASAQSGNTIGTVAGPGNLPFTGMALQTYLPNPTGIAEDSSGNIYIASQYSYYVYKLNPSTEALSIIAGTGIFGFTGDGGAATAATLSAAVAVAVDKSGNVYIVDGNRIRVVNTQQTPIVVLGQNIPAGYIQTVAGTGANCPNAGDTPPTCGDTGPASQATFYNPEGIYIDGFGNLFIADTTDQEIRFVNTGSSSVTVTGITVASGTVATLAGNGLICNQPQTPCGDGGPATAQGDSGAKLDIPIGIVTDSAGNVYIGDSRDQRIRCVANVAGGCPQTAFPNTAVGEIVTYAGDGSPLCQAGTSACGDGGPKLNAEFHNPSGIWLDSAGDLYIADQWDNRIREVTPGANGKVEAVCGTGQANYQDGKCTGAGAKTGAEFYGPLAIIVDSSGNGFIADSGNNLIREGSIKTGTMKTIAGTESVGDNGPATAASLANPVDVKWDNTGTNYYIVDNANNRIREVNTSTGIITTVVGTGHPSQACAEPPPPTCNGDNGPATLATLDGPNGMAVDASGNLYIADSSNSAVRVVNMQPSETITVATVSIPPGEIVTVAGQQGVECLTGNEPCGDGGPATEANIDYPIAVTVDPQGNIYIPDYFFSKIRCVANVAGACPNTEVVNGQALPPTVPGEIVTIAGIGGPLFNGNKRTANSARLNHPYGLGIQDGNLIFDDSGNNMVRCVANAAGGCGNGTLLSYIYDYALTGKSGYSGDGQLAINATETVPQGFGFDPAGNLFIGGGGDLVVRRIDATTQNIMTVAGTAAHPGNPGFGGDGGPSTSATLDNIGLAVNGSEELLIADQGNNRVRQVDMVPVIAMFEEKLNFGNVPDGTTSSPMTATMQNYGLATLPLGTTLLGGPDQAYFNIVSNTCVTQLPPGPESGAYKSTCSVEVTFSPTQVRSYSATLTINTSLGAEVVNLLGDGVAQ